MSACDDSAGTQPRRLVILDSISPAIERTKAMLFGPMVFGIWLRFGLLAFVEQLSRGGGGGGGGNYSTGMPGNSLFGFHLILMAMGLAALLVIGGCVYAAILARHDFATMLPWLIVTGILVLGAFVFFALADSLTRQFVTPIMVRDNQGWQAAWGKVGPVLLANFLPVIGYYLLKMVFWIGFGFAGMLVGCFTLCIAFLPVVHHTIFAPVYVFERNWTMVMLHYLGPGFEVFHEPEPAGEAATDPTLGPAPWESP